MIVFSIVLIIAMFLGSLLYFPELPSMIPMHWNVMGQVDSYWPKSTALWFLPILTVIMLVSFQVVPHFDPKKNKYKLFKPEWEIMQAGLVGFFAYIQFIIVYISLNPTVSMMPLMFIGLGTLFILFGNYMSKIRQNYFIGIKVPWTLANEDNWNKTHRFGSWCFVMAGIVTLAESYFLWFAPGVIFGSIILCVILPIFYSFLLYKKVPKNMKWVYIGLSVFIILLAIVRFFAGEDDWICKNGQWVMHGHPDSTMPTTQCR